MRNLLLLAALALPACAAQAGPKVGVPITSVPPGSKCIQSSALDTYVGQQASAELGARLMGAARAPKIRWVPHGAMVTMNYSESRLTVKLDEQNRVKSATCG